MTARTQMLKHLEAWLEHSVYEDERDEVRRKILALIREEPELVETRSWPEIRRMAEVEFGDLEVANEIRRQLGNRALFMLGARDFLGSDDALVFKIGRNEKGVRWIHVRLAPNDTYTVQFGRGPKVLTELDDVYSDNLHRVIEMHTGMSTSL